MPKLPNGDRAVVPLEKFTEYALNPQHPSGRHKARVFQAARGLTLADAAFLQETVRQIASANEATSQNPRSYGERYVIDFALTTNVGRAMVRSTWMLHYGDHLPRLTSCYVIKDK